MKITSVKARMSEEDVQGIIEEFVKIQGLSIENVKIGTTIVLNGNFRKGIKIPFQITLGIGKVFEHKVNVKLLGSKLLKIKVLGKIQNLILKKVLQNFMEPGMELKKDTIEIELSKIIEKIPYVIFEVKEITAVNGGLEIEAADIIYAPNKECVLNKEDAPSIEVEVKADGKGEILEDGYSKMRQQLTGKADSEQGELMEYIMLMPDIMALLWRLFKDKRVPLKTKVLVGSLITYLVSPFDIIPDFIPLVGKIDDVAIAFFALEQIINGIPEHIILENWNGKENIILSIREGIKYIYRVVGSENVSKLLVVIGKFTKKRKEDK